MTKKQRNAFYKKMLKEYKKEIQIERNFGLCKVVNELVGCPFYKSIAIFNDLDELISHRPEMFYDWMKEKTDDNSQFWFLPDDTTSRINLLEQVIKETS